MSWLTDSFSHHCPPKINGNTDMKFYEIIPFLPKAPLKKGFFQSPSPTEVEEQNAFFYIFYGKKK